jgi:universal stress protein E
MSSHGIMFAVASPGGVDPMAMDKAVRLALALDAELELFHCVFDVDVAHPGRFATRGAQEDIHEFVEQRRQQLEYDAERLRSRGVRVRTSVRWDYPIYEGIVRQVLRHKPSLLIAQSTRKGHAARLLLTQTDYKLIETCPCPLLLIKTQRPYANPCVIAALDPGHSRDKPAALDDAILDSASIVSDALSGNLLVFHARTPWEYALRRSHGLQRLPEAVENDMYTEYCARIGDQVATLAKRHDLPEGSVYIREADAAEALPSIADEKSADIITMGAVSRSRAGRVLIGHTAERVLDALDCDVLIAKPPGFRSPVSRQSAHRVERSAASRTRHIW